MFTPIFESTTVVADGTKKLNLQDLKLRGKPEGDGFKERLIILDSAGKFSTEYTWWNAEGEWPEGWSLKGDADLVEDVTINMGEGFYLDVGGNDGVSLQVSGGVNLNTLSYNLPAGYGMAGNATPVKIDLQDVKLRGKPDGDGFKERLIILDSAGKFSTEYTWWNAEGEWPEGWSLKGEADLVEGVDFEPGEGFYLDVGNNDNVSLEIKPPITK